MAKAKCVTEVTGLLQGYALLPDEVEPTLTWNGAAIAPALWRDIIAFFSQVYARHKSEAVLRLFYHEAKREWTAEVFPQKVSGASAKEDNDPVHTEPYGALMKAGWSQFGTIHSHAAMTAFQSGTDHKDEATSPGLHITVGTLDKVPTFHSRLVFRGQQYDTGLEGWVAVEYPAWLTAIPDEFRDELTTKIFARKLSEVPGEMSDRVKDWLDKVNPVFGGVKPIGHSIQGWRGAPYSNWGDTDDDCDYGVPVSERVASAVTAPVTPPPWPVISETELPAFITTEIGDVVDSIIAETESALGRAVSKVYVDNFRRTTSAVLSAACLRMKSATPRTDMQKLATKTTCRIAQQFPYDMKRQDLATLKWQVDSWISDLLDMMCVHCEEQEDAHVGIDA